MLFLSIADWNFFDSNTNIQIVICFDTLYHLKYGNELCRFMKSYFYQNGGIRLTDIINLLLLF